MSSSSKIIKMGAVDQGKYVVGRRRDELQTFVPVIGAPGRHAAAAAAEVADVDPTTPLDLARDEADRILAQARLAAQEMEEQAREQGYHDGLEQGTQEARAELAGQAQVMRGLAEQAIVDHETSIHELERQVIKLAMAVAGRIVGGQILVDPGVVARSVAAAMDQIDANSAVRVRVNPSDLEVLAAYWADTYGASSITEKIEITADPRISGGGCLIETETGFVDARVEVQLAEIERAFLEKADLG